MDFKVGSTLWLECDVKLGPFPNERFIRIPSNGSEWLGFVSDSVLRSPIESGSTEIKATVVWIKEELFGAKLPGYGFGTSIYTGSISKVMEIDSFSA